MRLHNLSEGYLHVLVKGFAFLNYCNILFCDENMSSFRRIFPLFYKIPCVTICFFTMTSYMIKLFSGELVFDENIVHATSVYVLCIQCLYRAAVLVSKKQGIKDLIIRLGCVWQTTDLSEEQTIKKNALLAGLNFRFAVLDWMIFIGSWQYMLVPLLDLLLRKFVLKQECGMLLPFLCDFPFDPTKNWLTYSAVYIFQVYSIFHVVYVYVGSDILLIALSSHLSTEFTLLQIALKNLEPEPAVNMEDETHRMRNADQNMRDLIRRHQVLISLAKDLDENFNGIIFMNLTCATIMICTFGLAIIFSKSAFNCLKNFIAIFSGTYPIYNVCFHAELLKEASLGVADAAYQNRWYNGTNKHRRAIWFIIKRSQTPCYLSSLKYNKISLSTFMSVLSTTWSYFSLALKISKDK